MAFVDWNPKYSVGVAQLDREHQQLFALINELHAAMIQGKGREVVGRTVTGLMTYVATHFRSEERMLEAARYAELAAHQAEHRAFAAKCANMHERIQAGDLALTIELLNLLKNWLTAHIQQNDQKYAPALAEKATV